MTENWRCWRRGRLKGWKSGWSAEGSGEPVAASAAAEGLTEVGGKEEWGGGKKGYVAR